ncbi:MAG: septum formation initiator family protein [Lachnospiraceae bacterium]|nr:septum formation initiator family protein [Lachnospiraceae bacterium]
MAKLKAAFQRQRQNRLNMFWVSFVMLMIVVVVMVKSRDLRTKIEEKVQQEQALTEQMEAQQLRAEEIEEYRKYTQTRKFIEETAKDKLGLVYGDEIVIRGEE